MAYQGVRGFDPQEIRSINEEFAPIPDHVLILEVPINIALERIGVRDGEANEFEQRDALEKCHAIFSALTDEFVQRIDATASPKEVHQSALDCIS